MRITCCATNTLAVYDLLIAKLRVYQPEYFRDTLGLRKRIEFKGYDRPVQATVPYSIQPVEFYKWWCANQDIINMTFEEKIILFNKGYFEKYAALKPQHKRLITRNKGEI